MIWGKGEEFVKDNNTLREVYRFKPSENFLKRIKLIKLPVIIIKNELVEETFNNLCGGFISNSNVAYSEYTEYVFLNETLEETFGELKGGFISSSEVTYNSFIEYTFLQLPFSGAYEDKIDNITGGMVYKAEVTYEG